MNLSSIASIAGRMLMRTLIKRGVSAGIDRTLGPEKAPKDMTPEERAKRQAQAQNAGRAKKNLRILRRFGRF